MEKENYYVEHEKALFKDFEEEFSLLKPHLSERYDEQTINQIHDKTKDLVGKIVPEIPQVTLKNPENLGCLLYMARFIPLYKVLKKHGMSVEDYIRIWSIVLYNKFKNYPKFALHLCGRLASSSLAYMHEEKLSKISQKKEYPKDWIFTATKGNPNPDISFTFQVQQCTMVIFMQEQGVDELMPYCDFCDFLYMKMMGAGYKCNPIGRGYKSCDVTFFKHGKYDTPTPDHLIAAFEGLEF